MLYFFDDSVDFVCTACSDKSAKEECRLNGLGLNYSKCVQVSMHCTMYVFGVILVWSNFSLAP